MSMVRKPHRPQNQIDRMAARFRERWSGADGVTPWLRRHLPLLTQINQDEGWSWADIGRALDVAGVSYATGHPWTGFLLARKIGQARIDVRARARKRMQESGPTPVRQVTGVVRSLGPTGQLPECTPDAAHERPIFVPASLAPSSFVRNRHLSEPGNGMEQAPAGQVRADVDEIIRRLRGGVQLESEE